jgi:hypothetical protein
MSIVRIFLNNDAGSLRGYRQGDSLLPVDECIVRVPAADADVLAAAQRLYQSDWHPWDSCMRALRTGDVVTVNDTIYTLDGGWQRWGVDGGLLGHNPPRILIPEGA